MRSVWILQILLYYIRLKVAEIISSICFKNLEEFNCCEDHFSWFFFKKINFINVSKSKLKIKFLEMILAIRRNCLIFTYNNIIWLSRVKDIENLVVKSQGH